MTTRDQFGDTTPPRLAITLGAAIAVLFVVGMGAMFHFIQTGNATWALTWWWITAAGVPAAVWVSFRLLRAHQRGAHIFAADVTQPIAADVTQPIAAAIAVIVIGATVAALLYG